MAGALLTDLYELNMAAAYVRRGMTAPATFSLFVRRTPPSRPFLVAVGIEECLDDLERFGFADDELAWLRDELGYGDDTIDALAALRFTGSVRAVPEGRLVLANEPLLEVTAPIAEAQLFETLLLNRVTFASAVAAKGARCRLAAGDAGLVDFSFRRTQGIDAGVTVARATAIVGFAATSNVEAARRFGLRAAGTMAHSFIESFPTEEAAFRAFAERFPDRSTFLVDTYDTADGVRTAVRVIHDLGLTENVGVRLDSGDLGALAEQARAILDGAGLHDVRIFASGGLDEHEIARLLGAGAPIDAFGVGTRLGVSEDAPYVDSVYKLVEYDGRPVLKLSAEKATLPGRKQVFRSRDGDVLSLADEPVPAGAEPLLLDAMRDGRRVGPPATIAEARERFEADLAALPDAAKRLDDPEAPQVTLSEPLRRLTDEVRARARSRTERETG
jgi:nicotinate phosphoribosyltransferase